jgi:hypothetical protein
MTDNVTEIHTYDTKEITTLSEEATQAFMNNEIDQVILCSPSTASSYANVINNLQEIKNTEALKNLPITAIGRTHWVLSLEASEPLRYQQKLGKATVVISDSYLVPPTNIRREDGDYYSLEQLTEYYKNLGCKLFIRPFRTLAKEQSGNPINANLLALGGLLKQMDSLIKVNDFAELIDEKQLQILRHSFESGSET